MVSSGRVLIADFRCPERLRAAAGIVLALLASALPATGQTPAARAGKSPADLARDVARSMSDYRAALARSLPAYEAAADLAARTLDERHALHQAGQLGASDVQEAERAWRAAVRELAEHRAAMAEADRIVFTATLHERLARLDPLPRNGYEDVHGFIRFNGRAPWAPGMLPTIAAAFKKVFGRGMDVSAYGQTPLHTRLGLDHRNAVDVAVHPDSSEGRWLVAYLRDAGISFIGVRDAVAGSSTGPHVHIGSPSLRTVPR
jgi:hypothetical protein